MQKEQIGTHPTNYAQAIEKAIKDYIATSPNNRFFGSPQKAIWQEPLVGYSNGDDPLFQQYKTIIGEFHVTPREALEKYIETTGWGDKKDLKNVSVISWVLPAAELTRTSNQAETIVPSTWWTWSRVQGQEFNFRLTRHMVALIEDWGYIAVNPEESSWWKVMNLPNGMASNWSHRHYAYAAGLGTFSLSDGFITPKGIAIRVGSVVCNLPIAASPRPYSGHYANCLFYAKGTCKKCIERCPAQAISEKGHDKIKCVNYLHGVREKLQELGRIQEYGNKIMGCGLCQTGVPCENKIPL